MNAAVKLPWKQILAHLPEVADGAKAAWEKWESRPKPAPVDPTASATAQLSAIAERVQALEDNEKSQSEIVSQVVGQLEGLATGLKETAARQTLILGLSVGAIALAVVALIIAIVM